MYVCNVFWCVQTCTHMYVHTMDGYITFCPTKAGKGPKEAIFYETPYDKILKTQGNFAHT